MSDIVTQCPHCKTSFKVGDEQLRAANGSVRCGACLTIFPANKHLLAETKTQKSHIKTSNVQQKVFADTSYEVFPDENDSLSHEQDLLFGDEPFSDEEDGFDLTDDFFNTEEEEKPKTSFFSTTEKPGPNDSYQDESWAADLLTEERVSESINAHKADTATKPKEESKTKAVFDSKDLSSKTHHQSASKKTLDANNKSSNSQTQSNANRDQTKPNVLNTIANIPIEMEKTQAKTLLNPLQLKWAGGCLLLILLLSLQTVLFHIDAFSTKPAWRTAFVKTCQIFQCEVPSLVNLKKLTISNLVIRSHPDHSNGLIVDAVIQNQASYEQPFQAIQLTFTNLQNHIVAQRSFKPKDYLAGQFTGITMMQANTPIHISLEILDPGNKAINYEMRFQAI